MPFVDIVIAQAETQKDHWVKNVGIPENRVKVIYNGINPGNFSRHINKRNKLSQLGIPSSEKIVGIVGRLVELKGIDIFIRAAKLVLDKYPDIFSLSLLTDRYLICSLLANKPGRYH